MGIMDTIKGVFIKPDGESTSPGEIQRRDLEKEYAKKEAYDRHMQKVAEQNKEAARQMKIKQFKRQHDETLEYERAKQRVSMAKKEARAELSAELKERKKLLKAQRGTTRSGGDTNLITGESMSGGSGGGPDMIMGGSPAQGKRKGKGQDFDMVF